MTSRYDHLAPIIIPYEDTDTSTVGHHYLYKVAHFKVPWVDCLATQQGVTLVIHTGNWHMHSRTSFSLQSCSLESIVWQHSRMSPLWFTLVTVLSHCDWFTLALDIIKCQSITNPGIVIARTQQVMNTWYFCSSFVNLIGIEMWSICLHFFHTVVLRKSDHFLTLHNIFIVKVVLRRSAHVNTIHNTSTSTVEMRKTAHSLRTTFPLKCKNRDNDNRCI